MLLVLLFLYAIYDYYPPETIGVREITVSGIKGFGVPDLVIQGSDAQHNIWATRGFWAYKRPPLKMVFLRQYHIPTGMSICWFGNFSIVRWLVSRDIWVELLPFNDGEAIAASGNKIWCRSVDGVFINTFKFKYGLAGIGGVGIGTGVLPSGLLLTRKGRVLIGEYWGNSGFEEVNVYASDDRGRNWARVYRFERGAIRHIHGIQQDAYDGSIWMCTGDDGNQAKILRTNEEFKNVTVLQENSQQFRTTGLVLDDQHVCWGTDTSQQDVRGIYRADKEMQRIEKLSEITGTILMTCTLENRLMVMSESRDHDGAQDDSINIYLIRDGSTVKKITLDRRKTYHLFKNYSWARLARGGALSSLYLTLLNVEKYNGMLLVFPESSL